MKPKWRGWTEEGTRRRGLFVATFVVLAALAVVAVVGTITGDGLASAWLWIGLVLVPVLLWLVREAGLSK